MNLETERLILRPWSKGDAEDLYHACKDPAIGPAAGWPAHRSLEESRQVLDMFIGQQQTYAIEKKGNGGHPIGCIGLKLGEMTDLTRRTDECELGYWLAREHRGTGVMPEACRALIGYAFKKLGMNALWCAYYAGNEKSKRVQEKLGFVYDHTEENAEVPLLGERRTVVANLLTKERWQRLMETAPEKRRAILYIHGKGGCGAEAERLKPLLPGYDIVGPDFEDFTPWGTRDAICTAYARLTERYETVIPLAVSIGAYFAMHALGELGVPRMLFVSPVLDLGMLIANMMQWAGVTEAELKEKKIVPTDFGEDLSWDYRKYVLEHPVKAAKHTSVLWTPNDALVPKAMVDAFTAANETDLTVMENGEHWFHTEEQLAFLDKWLKARL